MPDRLCINCGKKSLENAKPKRYSIWDAKTITIISTIVMVLTTGLVFIVGHNTVFAEIQITLSVISLALFSFQAIGLYRGVRIKKRQINGPDLGEINLIDTGGNLAIPTIDLDLDVGEGIVGVILSVVLWLIVSVVLLFVLASIASVLWAVFLVLAFCVYWVFYRALRQVFAKSRICRGKILPSLGYSLLYTSLYTGWLFTITWGSKLLF